MKLHVKKSSSLVGKIVPPPNKSHSMRALIFASLARGTSRIINPKISSDWDKAVYALTQYGATIVNENNSYIINGINKNLKVPADIIDCGNSGQLLRFLMGVASNCEGYTVLTGDSSLRNIRIAQPLIDALNNLGAFAVSTKNDGHAPIVIKGKIQGGKTLIDGFDSQSVSGLLIGCAMAKNSSEIFVKNPGEKPWVQLTLTWLDKVGITYEIVGDNFDHFRIKGNDTIKPFTVDIPKDWSAALYPILSAIITPNSKLSLKGLDFADAQGDKKVVEILRQMGAEIKIVNGEIFVKNSKLKGMKIDCNDFVDQFMLLAMAAAYAEGESYLYNAEVCRFKECDRISVMNTELKKMGVEVKELNDGLIINGGKKLRGTYIDGHKDHRVVMTFAVGALQAEGETVISDAEYIEKSFDTFIEQMQNCNAKFLLS